MRNEKEKRLPFYTFTVGGKSYMLRLTAGAAVRLEDRLGCSVYEGLKRLSEIKVVTEFLYAVIESLSPEITKNTVYMIFDEYISEGGTLKKLNGIISETLERSGFFDSGDEANPPQSL